MLSEETEIWIRSTTDMLLVAERFASTQSLHVRFNLLDALPKLSPSILKQDFA